MENKKSIIIVIVILVLYFLLMVVIIGINQIKNKFSTFEIIMEPGTYLKYEKGKWEDVIDSSTMLGKSYNIYGEHKFLYEGVLQYAIDKWYAFDNNNEPLSLPDNFFAYRGNRDIKVQEFEIIDMTEEEINEAKELLKSKNVTIEPVFKKTKKIEFDFDNDGEKEQVYFISNDYDLESQTKVFSIAYMKNNSKIETLISHISEDYTDIPTIMLKEIIDYNDDGKYELIFRKTYFDQIGTCYEIFELEKGIYKPIKKCNFVRNGGGS